MACGCAPSTDDTREVAPVENDAFVERLFDGETLEGWYQVGGDATYEVDDGCIVGTVGPGPNSFLRTERTFDHFELRLEFKFDEFGNSGIQFRSHQRNGDGPVHGYQYELDPSPRSWTGGIYYEGGPWLYNLEDRPEARAAFKRDGWNSVVIRCEGTRNRTWLNGVACADLVHSESTEGFIALQVHGGNSGKIRWRNITLRTLQAVYQ